MKVFAVARKGVPQPGWYSLLKESSGDADPFEVEITDVLLLDKLNSSMEKEFTKASISDMDFEIHDPNMTWFNSMGPGGALQVDANTGYFSPWIRVEDDAEATIAFGYVDYMSLEHEPLTAQTSFTMIPAVNLLKDRKLSDYTSLFRPNPTLTSSGTPVQYVVKNQDTINYDSKDSIGSYHPWYRWGNMGNTTAWPVRDDIETRFDAELQQGRIPYAIDTFSRQIWGQTQYFFPTLPAGSVLIAGTYYPCHAEFIDEDTRDYGAYYDPPPITYPFYYDPPATTYRYRVIEIVLDETFDLRALVDTGTTLTFGAPNVEVDYYSVISDIMGDDDAGYKGDKFVCLNTIDQLVPGDTLTISYTEDQNESDLELKIIGIDGIRNRVIFDDVVSGTTIPKASVHGVVRQGNDPVQVGFEFVERACSPFTIDRTQFEKFEFTSPIGTWLPYTNGIVTPVFGAFWLQNYATDEVYIQRRGDGEPTSTSAYAVWRGSWDSLTFVGAPAFAINHFGPIRSWPGTIPQAPIVFQEGAMISSTERANGYAVQPWRSRRRGLLSVSPSVQQSEILDGTLTDWTSSNPTNRNGWYVLLASSAFRLFPDGSIEQSAYNNSGGHDAWVPVVAGRARNAAKEVYAAGPSVFGDDIMYVEEDGRVVVYHSGTKLVDTTITLNEMGGSSRVDCGGGLLVHNGVGVGNEYSDITKVIVYPMRSRIHYWDGTDHFQLDLPCIEVVAHTICPIAFTSAGVAYFWACLGLEDYTEKGGMVDTQLRVRLIQLQKDATSLSVFNGELEPNPLFPNRPDYWFKRGTLLESGLTNMEVPLCMCNVNSAGLLMGLINGRPFQVAPQMADYIEKVPLEDMTAFDLLEKYCAANLAAAIPEASGTLRIVSRHLGTLHYTYSGGYYSSIDMNDVRGMKISATSREFISNVTVTYGDDKKETVTSSFGGGVPAELDFGTIITSPMAAHAVAAMYAEFYGHPVRTYTFSLASNPDWKEGDRVVITPSASLEVATLGKITQLTWNLDGDRLDKVEIVELP